jgi:hypothetical protein
MNRRGFFGAIAGLVAGAELDPEKLLWKPGKLISIPRPAPLTAKICAQLALEQLKNSLAFQRAVDREYARTFQWRLDRSAELLLRKPYRFLGTADA